MLSYVETTKGITVAVQPLFLEERSNVMKGEFVFVYFITITNNSSETVQLLRRHWYIADSIGENQEVEGDGVVGQQPVIEPGKSYMYNSFCVLKSFEGTMEGTYTVRDDEGNEFDIIIPRFYLAARSN